MAYIDYYSILGLKKDATQDEIKKVYRKLARKSPRWRRFVTCALLEKQSVT
jgi:preprotein translocase subunit Sec63